MDLPRQKIVILCLLFLKSAIQLIVNANFESLSWLEMCTCSMPLLLSPTIVNIEKNGNKNQAFLSKYYLPRECDKLLLFNYYLVNAIFSSILTLCHSRNENAFQKICKFSQDFISICIFKLKQAACNKQSTQLSSKFL